MSNKERIAVIGAGVAGLTAAHLLNEAGFEVTIFEKSNAVGGQAKSGYVKDDLPTEHAMRFMNNRYLCLLKIMSSLHSANVIDDDFNLTNVDFNIILNEAVVKYRTNKKKKNSIFIKIKNIINFFSILLRRGLRFKEVFKVFKIQYLFCLSKDHLLAKYDQYSVDDLFNLKNCSRGWFTAACKIPQLGTAALPHSSAILALTALDASSDLVKDLHSIKVFNGPNSEALFDCWINYLTQKGVLIHFNKSIHSFSSLDNKILNLKTENNEIMEFDYFILGTDYHSSRAILESSGLLEKINLPTQVLDKCFEWANGIQFYFTSLPNADTGYYPGLSKLFLDSPWGITSLMQGNGFWKYPGKIRQGLNILSLNFTNPYEKGLLFNKALLECSPDEVKHEILAQCGINDISTVSDWHIDDGLKYYTDLKNAQKNLYTGDAIYQNKSSNGIWINHSRPFTPIPGYYSIAPKAETSLENLLLVGEYCDADYFIPSMEKAAESSFRAVNLILKKFNMPSLKLSFDYNHRRHRFFRKLDALFYRCFSKIRFMISSSKF